MDSTNYLLNECQTPIEDLHLSDKPKEVQDQFWDFFTNVPLIRWMVDANRPRAKDIERDSEGKIIVDVTKPHILEDMDYFRPTAIHYQETGRFTDLRPNLNPNSEYYKWMKEEIRRCWDGYIRESDGEWITGDHYYFLNYFPILQSINKNEVEQKLTEGHKRKVTGSVKRKTQRISDFPKVWEGHYLKFHYINQAREEGKHGTELARRGCGKSYTGAAMLSKRFMLGESLDVQKEVQCVVTAYEKKYLTGANQILDMFKKNIDFLALNTEWPAKKLTNSMQLLQWKMGYKDLDSDAERGTLNSVIGITSKDDESKLRGSRGVLYLVEEMGSFPRLLGLYSTMRPSVEDGDDVFGLLYLYGCVCAGTKVWTNNGRLINIEDLKKKDGIIGYLNGRSVKNTIGTLLEPREKPCVKISFEYGDYLECSIDHPILTQIIHTPRIDKNKQKRYRVPEEKFVRAANLKIGDRVIECRQIDAFGADTLEDARLVGMLIGDGSYGYDNTPKFSNEDKELLDYIKTRYSWGISGQHTTKEGKLYQDIRIKGICQMLRSAGIYGQTKTAKRLPANYQTLTKKDTQLLLAGLYDTDGCFYVRDDRYIISLTQSTREILEEVSILLRKFGIIATINKNKPSIKEGRKDKNPWYILVISGKENVELFAENVPIIQNKKIQKLNEMLQHLNNIPLQKVCCYNRKLIRIRKVKNIEYIGIQTIYNLSAEQSHTYLANNIITHNTAGDEAADFAAAQEIMYNPKGYNMLALPNVYDKEGQGKTWFTSFFPGYVNRAGCYDSNGNSDVTKAILEIIEDRYLVKYNSSDVSALTKRIAEIPITPQEAIMKVRGNLFPVTELTERLNQLDNNPTIFDNVLVGQLVSNGDSIKFVPTTETPIRHYPLRDNKNAGALEIFKLPENDSSGKPTSGRYIIGHDPVDDDEANTMSLTSTFVFDLFTDQIVAEYTGRLPLADDNFEIVRKLCLFYNAECLYESNKKGIFAYFNRMNCLYLLADTPEYLKDKDIIKEIGSGNKAKGVNATAPVNNYANRRIREWLLKPITSIKKLEKTDEDGTTTVDDYEVTEFNLYGIMNRALLEELIAFDARGNFDRVRALGMVMLYREKFLIDYDGDVQNGMSRYSSENSLEEDDFFKRMYDNKLNEVIITS